MKQYCIICNNLMDSSLVLNGIPMLQCDTCKLIRREVFDISTDYYEDLESKDFGIKRIMRERNSLDRIKLLNKFVSLHNLCDVGTGEGIFLEVLKKTGINGAGVEPSKSSRIKAKQNGVSIIGNSLEDIVSIIESHEIKTVSLFHVIEHLENPNKAISDIYQALPKGGCLIIETQNIDSWVFKACNFKNKLIYTEHLWYFSFETLKKLLLKNSFHIITSGKRDFDQYNLPIKESLYRLGILPESKVSIEFFDSSGIKQIDKDLERKDNIVRTIIRSILSRVVIMTGRLQYVYFIVQKK